MAQENMDYGGRRFADVYDALCTPPYQNVWDRIGDPTILRPRLA